MLELIVCPDPTCATIAEIVDRVTIGSIDGPIEVVRTLCLHRHIFLLPVERLGGLGPPERVNVQAASLGGGD